jgi:hypothetical protein
LVASKSSVIAAAWAVGLSICRYFHPSSLKAPPKPLKVWKVVESLTVTVAFPVAVATIPVCQNEPGAEVKTKGFAGPVTGFPPASVLPDPLEEPLEPLLELPLAPEELPPPEELEDPPIMTPPPLEPPPLDDPEEVLVPPPQPPPHTPRQF